MQFGIIFANVLAFGEPDGAVALAAAAEDAGFESLWTVEHVVVPAGYESEYPYSSTGRMPGGETAPIPDPFIWLSYVAAVTHRIRLATGITILPQRNPVVLAKAVATLDRLSGGRVLLGVGAGWLREEFDAIGVPFQSRGARLDDHIKAMRALWTEDSPSYDGEFVSFSNAYCRPQPIQAPVPIIVGGHTDRAARRAGELGDGFFPGRSGAETLGPLLDTMRRAATDAGRDPDGIEITASGAMDVDAVKRFADMGVSRIVIPPLAFDNEGIGPALRRFSDEVISKVA